jgi:UDP-GlcNAc:undecaprenyl-phosphate GlcNAc-1-phosphate transferase
VTKILAAFIVSLAVSILITPLVGKAGYRLGGLDFPQERKVHFRPVPRVGGLAICLAFLATLVCIGLIFDDIGTVLNRKFILFGLGAAVCFGVGLTDDFTRLSHKTKFLFQIIGATIAFAGGTNIALISTQAETLGLVPSYLLTVFWFVLFMNAVNLIDGLDGLAGGICFFTSIIMVILSILKGEHLLTLCYAALGGAILGFLRYNFNPASIFMGDGGSYLLGYLIAGFSIIGSQKSQVGVTVLIPLLAMGVPVFDTILSPIRRFLLGKEMFKPDKGHIHHRLVGRGFSARATVWLIYGLSAILCLYSIILVNLRDEQAGLFLIVLAAGAVVFTHKLGYFEYLAYDKIYGWFRDISDSAGITRDRRSFLNVQMEIGDSKTIGELWSKACRAFAMLRFDRVVFRLNLPGPEDFPPTLSWAEKDCRHTAIAEGNHLLRLELPLTGKLVDFGKIIFEKDLAKDPITHFTLRRVENLRQTLAATIQKIVASRTGPELFTGERGAAFQVPKGQTRINRPFTAQGPAQAERRQDGQRGQQPVRK